MNNLLYSIRSFKPGDRTFTFDTASKGFDQGVWTKVEQEPPTPILPVIKPKTFKFIAATDFTNANLFPNATYWEDQPYDFENVVVKINDVVVEQKANSITGKAGDTVEFIAENGVFPLLGGNRHRPSSSAVPDIIGEILTPMPVMTAQPISIPITDEYLDEDTSILSWLFAYKENITKIPSDFFKYYRSISSLYMTFYGVPFATDIDLYDISLSDSCPADEVKGCFRTFDHTINIHCAQDSNTYKVFSEAIKYAEDNSTDYFSVHGINLVTE